MWINKQIAYDRYQKYVKYSVSCITTISCIYIVNDIGSKISRYI